MSNIGWLHPKNDAGEWDGFNDSGMEHFAGDPNLHLAREVNQNSYDAATGEPVKVVIKLVEEETQSIPNIEEYIQTIELCKTASEEESEKAIDFFKKASNTIRGKKINVLQIEDFNTSGIEGPAKLGKPYYAFMKAKGQSKKTANTASGSYGIGKFAPYAVSGLRTVFVSTVYEDENKQHKQITQGKSILITHDAPDGSRRQGTGYWGIKDGNRL